MDTLSMPKKIGSIEEASTTVLNGGVGSFVPGTKEEFAKFIMSEYNAGKRIPWPAELAVWYANKK